MNGAAMSGRKDHGALERLVDHMQAHERVWICLRTDIARHWQAHHPPP